MGNLSIRIQIAAPMVAVALLVALSVAGLLFWQTSELTAEAQNRELRGYAEALESMIDAETRAAERMAALVAEIPDVQTAFAAADRARLAELFVPGFAKMKADYDIRQFQFHIPPATSFLRVHKPAKFGDDLSGFRQTVLDANEKREAIRGLEKGVAGVGVRGVVPVAANGRHVGTVEFGLSFDQPFFEAFKYEFGVEAAFFLKSADGVIEKASTFDGSAFDLTSNAVAAIEGEPFRGQFEIAGKSHAFILFPVNDFNGHAIGAALVAMDTGYFEAAESQTLFFTALVALISACVAGLLGLFIARGVAGPISKLTQSISRLADGDLDISPEGTERKNEIGAIARALEVFRSNAQERQRLEQEQEEMKQKAAAERKAEQTRMADQFDANVTSVIDSVVALSAELEAASGAMSSDASSAGERMAAVSSAMEETASIIQAMATATEEMRASIDEIARQTGVSAEVSREAVSESSASRDRVRTLSESSEKIGGVIAIIRDIAEQTNLLALNATIEAARAGEMGKGFAVVASEVKQLANQTAKAVEEVAAHIDGVQQSMQGTVDSIDRVGGAITKVDEVAGAIASAVEEQTATTREISDNVQQTAEASREAASNVVEASRISESINGRSGGLASSAKQLSENAERLKSAARTFIDAVRAA